MACKKALLIGDPHAEPDYSNERFDWLGNYILEEKPDLIWCAGDLSDMPSLSSYDKGTKGFEGRRYKRDVEVTIDAQQRMFGPMQDWNRRQAKNRKAQYNPRKVLCVGNHCERLERAVNAQPELEGTISMQDLQFEKYWDEVYPFKTTGVVEGFAVSHFFTTGVMGRPVGGECPADACLKKLGMSNISGHSHLLDIKTRTRADGSKMLSIVAGCYVHPEMISSWNRNTASLWFNGIIILHDVENGFAQGIETMSQERVRNLYG